MSFIETIIIGSGPAGIQTGFFLDKLNRDYLIIERNSIPGSFFSKYPISKKLISINKKYNGSSNPDFNLRYDWNSLLNDSGLLFGNYSDELYPNSDSLLKYLLDFTVKIGIKIRYNSNVMKILKKDGSNDINYEVHLENEIYTCKYLIIATGLRSKTSKKFKTYEDMSNVSFDEFRDKRVCIVGSGNSAYELAHMLSNKSRFTIIFNKKVNLSILTHYPGDLRGNYLYILDLFSLKLLTAAFQVSTLVTEESFTKQGNEYRRINVIDAAKNYKFDEVIFCTGFEFDDSFFDFPVTRNGKYPDINDKYESTNNKNLFFVGALMHSLDSKMSAGGFIHGFRYLIKFFIESVYDKYKTLVFDTINSLAKHIYHRINISSSLYLMFNFMCDIVYIKDGYFIYIQDLTMENIKLLNIPHLVVYLKTKKFNTLDEFFNQSRNFLTDSKFLHPSIIINNNNFKEEIMFLEDTLGLFGDIKYFHGIVKAIEKFTNDDVELEIC